MQRAINLTFHGIGECTRGVEPSEERVWVSSEQFHSVLDSVAGRSDVRITFDDGNASDVEHALPALRRRGLTGTFFVVASRIGTPGFLDADDLCELSRAGMTIGSHGMSHRPWRRLDGRELREELLDARRLLEEIVGRPVTRAACPFGSYDRHVLRSLRRCGYLQVYTSDRGTARSDRWIQPRNTVQWGDDGGLVEQILSLEQPAYNALRRRAKLVVKRWR